MPTFEGSKGVSWVLPRSPSGLSPPQIPGPFSPGIKLANVVKTMVLQNVAGM